MQTELNLLNYVTFDKTDRVFTNLLEVLIAVQSAKQFFQFLLNFTSNSALPRKLHDTGN